MTNRRELIVNDIRVLMDHLGELTTVDVNDHQVADLARSRALLVDVVSTLSGLSDEDVWETLDECRMQVMSRG